MSEDNRIRVNALEEIMNTDLTTVSTEQPLVVAGLHSATVKEVTVVDNKEQTGQLIKIVVTLDNLTDCYIGDKKSTVNPGWPITTQISLTKVFEADGTTVRYDPIVNVTKFAEAVLGVKPQSLMPLEQYIGRKVGIKTSIDAKQEDKFGKQVRIDRFVKIS